jgi:hypothetical protein
MAGHPCSSTAGRRPWLAATQAATQEPEGMTAWYEQLRQQYRPDQLQVC